MSKYYDTDIQGMVEKLSKYHLLCADCICKLQNHNEQIKVGNMIMTWKQSQKSGTCCDMCYSYNDLFEIEN